MKNERTRSGREDSSDATLFFALRCFDSSSLLMTL